MIRKLLNKYHAGNFQELFGNVFRNIRQEKVADEFVKKVVSKEYLAPRTFEFKDILEKNRLADILPYEWFDEEIGIYQTTRAHGFVFDCGTLVGCKEDLDDQLKGLFSLGLPDGTCMQILMIASSELSDKFAVYESSHQSELLQKVAQRRTEFYSSGLKKTLRQGYKLPVRDFKLVISFTFDGLFDESNSLALITLQKSISSVLKNSFVANQIMLPNKFINLVRELTCTSMKPIEKHEYDKRRAIRDQIADIDNNIYEDVDGLVINDVGIKSIAVSRYPDQFSIMNCDKFLGDPFSIASQISYPFFITQNITFLNPSAENTKLNTAAVKTSVQVQKGKFTALFPIFHKKHAEYQLLQKVISNGEGLMLMNHMVHVQYPLGESAIAFQEIRSLYKSFGWTMVTNSNLQLPALLCSLPLFHDLSSSIEQKRYRMMMLYTQTNVVNLMPLFADYKGTGNPVLMLLSTRGQLMFYDLFQSNTNYNVAISANSGAGKSVFTNELVKSYRAVKAKISIIDVGRSYVNTSSALDGQYIEFTKEANICINPFSFIQLKLDDNVDYDLANITKQQLLSIDDLDDQITMLKAIFLVSAGVAEDDPRYQLADSFFEQAIIESLRKYQTNSTYTTVYNELLLIDEPNGVAKNLAESIKSYTVHGIFGRYFEGQSNLNMDNDVVVLELEELQGKGNLKFIVLLILMLKVTQEMYLSPRDQKKICIIDEAWDLMGGGNTGKFIVTGYRRARRYNGSFITITQKIDDYSENATTAACYSNAGIKIMLQQNPPQTVELDPYTLKLLKSLKSEAGVYSELIIQMNEVSSLCRLLLDSFSQLMYSSKASDFALLKCVKESENLETAAGIDRTLEIRDTYIRNFKRPWAAANDELLEHIKEFGYSGLIQRLHLEREINA